MFESGAGLENNCPALSLGSANLLSVLPLLPLGQGKRKTFGINVAFFGEKKCLIFFISPKICILRSHVLITFFTFRVRIELEKALAIERDRQLAVWHQAQIGRIFFCFFFKFFHFLSQTL
jgi:hypothetical protein